MLYNPKYYKIIKHQKDSSISFNSKFVKVSIFFSRKLAFLYSASQFESNLDGSILPAHNNLIKFSLVYPSPYTSMLHYHCTVCILPFQNTISEKCNIIGKGIEQIELNIKEMEPNVKEIEPNVKEMEPNVKEIEPMLSNRT
jgi:hypothetical protein